MATTLALLIAFAPSVCAQPASEPVTIRVAVFHLPGVRTRELLNGDSARVRTIAQIIQRLRPNILAISGLDRDEANSPDAPKDAQPGMNARRFVDRYLAISQAKGLAPLKFDVVMPVTNSGQPSGIDLDRNGAIADSWVDPPIDSPMTPEDSTTAARYSGDCWGPGAYPGQRGIAILVDPRLKIDREHVRTIRLMPWDYMPANSMPEANGSNPAWLSEEDRKTIRLASTTLIDVPVQISNGASLHVVSMLPIEIGGRDDGQLRARRHRDEIRLLTDYIEGQGYIVDDAGQGGGLELGSSFVILANLNASPNDADAFRDPIGRSLLVSPRLNASVTPKFEPAEPQDPKAKPSDKDTKGAVKGKADPAIATTRDGRRLDYVLPSKDLGIRAAGVWRFPPTDENGRALAFPGLHDPVWMDLWIRPPAQLPPDAGTTPQPGESARQQR